MTWGRRHELALLLLVGALAWTAAGYGDPQDAAQVRGAAESCAEDAATTGGPDVDLYCIELLPAIDIERASGTARLLPPASPFGLAVTAAGEQQYDIEFNLRDLPDDQAVFRYEMHTLPSEIGDRIGTSTLFAAWNAAIYVNQIEDERLDAVVMNGAYLEATQKVLQKYGGLWFNDEAFVVTRRRD